MTATSSAPTLPYPDPANSGQYADDLIASLGDSDPSATDEDVVSAWVQSESPGFPGWNGLGTELSLPGATPDPSNPAVYDYPSLEEGLEAAVDMMLGNPPQSTALENQFVSDLVTNKASAAALISDIQAGGWDGSGGDSYDADAIASKLSSSNFSVAGSPADPSDTSSGAEAQTVDFWSDVEGAWEDIGKASGSTTVLNPAVDVSSWFSSWEGDVDKWILQGVLTILGAGLILYGATVTAQRGGGKQAAGGAVTMIPNLLSSGADLAEELGPAAVAA